MRVSRQTPCLAWMYSGVYMSAPDTASSVNRLANKLGKGDH